MGLLCCVQPLSALVGDIACAYDCARADDMHSQGQGPWGNLKKLYMPSLVPVAEDNEKKMKDQHNQKVIKTVMQQTKGAPIADGRAFLVDYMIHNNQASLLLLADKIPLFDDTIFQDLFVFSGSPDAPAKSLFSMIDRTVTVGGSTALLDLVYHPLDSVQQLTKRQNAIKMIYQNDTLYDVVFEKLQRIKAAEKGLFLLLDKKNNKQIKNATSYLFAKNITHLPGVKDVAQDSLASSLFEHVPFFNTMSKAVCDKCNEYPQFIDVLRYGHYVNDGFIYPVMGLTTWVSAAYSAWKNKSWFSATMAGLGFVSVLPFIVKKAYDSVHESACLEKAMSEYVSLMAEFIFECKAITKAVQDVVDLDEVFASAELADEEQKAFDAMVMLCESIRADVNQSGLQLQKGKVFTALRLFLEKTSALVPLYLKVGCIDALVSIVTLIKNERSSGAGRYYFANYQDQENPHVRLDDFWNPFLRYNAFVKNGLELGVENGYRNIVLTSPAAGGKTTALKSLAYAVLLAQTLTIANARIALTPFSKLFTTTKLSHSASDDLFQTVDKERIQNVLWSFVALTPDQKALLIYDELFNTAAVGTGGAFFYTTLRYISDAFPQVVFVAASHFNLLTQLEASTGGMVLNFHMERILEQCDHGEVGAYYNITPGVASAEHLH